MPVPHTSLLTLRSHYTFNPQVMVHWNPKTHLELVMTETEQVGWKITVR